MITFGGSYNDQLSKKHKMETIQSDQIQIVSKDRKFTLPDIHCFLGLFFHSRNGLQKLRLLKPLNLYILLINYIPI